MEHFIEHAHSGHWIDSRFGEGASSLPAIDDICIPSSSCYHHSEMNAACLSGDSASMRSSLLPQPAQEAHATMMCPTVLRRPHIRKEMKSLRLPHANVTSPLHDLPYYSRSNVSDRSNSAQATAPQASPTWCQSYINRPRPDGALADAVSSGEAEYDKADRKRKTQNAQFRGNNGGEHAGPSQMMKSDAQQLHQQIEGCHQEFISQTGIHTGVAQLQGAAEAVATTARPRVRARRGQATDPHSIAERLRRERIAERMKALQELVPNANKTDKPSMLDEIIDYVKFLQLQVKVLSMSRLGGAGAVAPLVADFQVQGQTNLVAALHPSGCHDRMAVAEQRVARLMEEDMGSAMQFLQAKGLCLMPISLASVISDKNWQMMTGAYGGSIRQHIIHGMDTAKMHAASSTSSTLASATSSGCLSVEGDSKSK